MSERSIGMAVGHGTGVAGAPQVLFRSTFDTLTDQYGDRLGLDWRRRSRLLAAHRQDFATLRAWDRRMQAAIEALAVLGEPGCDRRYAGLHEPLVPSAVFSATVQALVADDERLFIACADSARTLPRLNHALLAAAEWVAPHTLFHALERWPVDEALGTAMALRALAVTDADPGGERLTPWRQQAAHTPETLCALFDAARLRARPEWVGDRELEAALEAAYLPLRLAAIRHALLFTLRERYGRAVRAAGALALKPGLEGDAAAWILACEPGRIGTDTMAALAAEPALVRRYILALGWHGHLRAIALLYPCLSSPAHARLAALSLMLLTGADPAREGWEAAAPSASPPEDAALPSSDPDRGLPWPSETGFNAWWSSVETRFDPNQTYLLGQPRTRANLVRALCLGPLRWRPMVAWQLQRQTPTDALPTHAPAHRQHPLLANLERTCDER